MRHDGVLYRMSRSYDPVELKTKVGGLQQI